MENLIISNTEFEDLIKAYRLCMPKDLYKTVLLNKLLELEADRTTFSQWANACSVDDGKLRKLAVQRLFELAKSFDEYLETCNWAYNFGFDDIKNASILELFDDNETSVEKWIEVYDRYDVTDIVKLAFAKITNLNPTFDQWIVFCNINDCELAHIKFALQQLREVESSFGQWAENCSNDRYRGAIRQLALQALSEKSCNKDDLFNAYILSEYDELFRAVVMKRFSELEATEDEWRDVHGSIDRDSDLGILSGKKILEIRLNKRK